jgi:hypothetical protein
LSVKGTLFVLDVKSSEYKEILKDLVSKEDEKKLNHFFAKPFEPVRLPRL